jgi:hypothetical protein
MMIANTPGFYPMHICISKKHSHENIPYYHSFGGAPVQPGLLPAFGA